MAHKIENMVSTKGLVPWHGIATVLPQQLITSEEIIQYVPNFNFKVEKRQNTTFLKRERGRIETIALSDSFSNVRINQDGTESILCGRVGRNYTPIQNVDAFKFFDNVVGKGEAIYETAGILKQGRAIFLLAVLPDFIKILGHEDDKIRPYMLLANWHDGTSSLLAMLTPIRVVCNNTLNMALNNNFSQVSIRHTASAEGRMEEASRLMGLVNQYNMEIGKVFNKMALAKITPDELLRYVNTLLPIKKEASDLIKGRVQEKRDKVLQLVEVGHGAQLETAKGTVWGAFNAVAEFIDHETTFKTLDARADSLLFGTGYQKKQLAFNHALVLADDKRPISNINVN